VADVLGRRSLIAASSALFGVAAVAGYFEAAPFFSAGPTAQEQFVAWRDGRAVDGLSVSAHTVLMNSCLLALTSAYGRAQPTPERLQVARACAARATEETAANPSFAYGWYVLAMASSHTGDWGTMNRALGMAQSTASTEQWLAELRVALAEDNFDRLTPAILAQHERDLALLVRSRRGISSIAARYVANPGFRNRITDIVEQLDPSSQRAFIDAVRAAAG
jgi:hypothetical protein